MKYVAMSCWFKSMQQHDVGKKINQTHENEPSTENKP